MKNFKYILFDLDGTLTDPKLGITKSVTYALNHFGITPNSLDDLCKFIGPPLTDSFKKYYGFSDEDAILGVEKYREYFGVTGIFENSLIDGIDKLLITLKSKGKTLIVATSKPTVFALKVLEHFDLLKYFDFVAGSELDGTRVAKHEVIAYALEQCNISDLAAAIMIGDREHDILGAKRNGIASVGVLFGYGSLDELTNAGADYIAASVEDIYPIID